MKPRWLQSRTARKFFRNKLAVASLAVIVAYLCVALAVLLGAISLDQTDQRVGMDNEPGFFLTQEPEKRLENCEILLDKVEVALKKSKWREALGEIRYGNIGVADKSREELTALVQRGWAIYDKLADSEDLDEDPKLLSQLDALEDITAELYPYPAGWAGRQQSLMLLLGTDRQGRSILLRAVYSIKVAIQIGVVTAIISVVIGSLLGAAAAFYGRWVDHVVIWLYTTFSSIPNLVLLVLLAYMFSGDAINSWINNAITFIVPGHSADFRLDKTLFPVYVALGATFWIGPCRVIRGETMKIKELEYIQAATAIGFKRFYIMLRHILPNVAHLMLVNFSLLFIGAIKSEVILSFLNLGVKEGPSWGIMISQSAHEVVMGFFWQIGAATAFMFVLVLAFNILSDALQDVFDPKHL